jgi:hypothetical protein
MLRPRSRRQPDDPLARWHAHSVPMTGACLVPSADVASVASTRLTADPPRAMRGFNLAIQSGLATLPPISNGESSRLVAGRSLLLSAG